MEDTRTLKALLEIQKSMALIQITALDHFAHMTALEGTLYRLDSHSDEIFRACLQEVLSKQQKEREQWQHAVDLLTREIQKLDSSQGFVN